MDREEEELSGQAKESPFFFYLSSINTVCSLFFLCGVGEPK